MPLNGHERRDSWKTHGGVLAGAGSLWWLKENAETVFVVAYFPAKPLFYLAHGWVVVAQDFSGTTEVVFCHKHALRAHTQMPRVGTQPMEV